MKAQQKWVLDTIFSGGSASTSFAQFLDALISDMRRFNDRNHIRDNILFNQNLIERMDEASSYVGCLLAQDVLDAHAELLEATLEDAKAMLFNISNQIDQNLARLSDADFQQLFQDKDLQSIAFALEERRLWAKQKLDVKAETLINDLSIDGYHSWGNLYSTIIGQETIEFHVNGKKESLSWGQAYNRLSSPDRAMRKAVFESSNCVWKNHQRLYNHVLNHISGFRLKMYAHRGWDVLKEPLHDNRMSQATLDVMWRTIEENKSIFVDYMRCKAHLLGLDKLSWYDQEAPLKNTGAERIISYDEAVDFIVEQFAQVSPKLSDYAKRAFSAGWIEAEDRGGKRPGGFCTGFPLNKESRIFMTYSGTNESLFTLAHELGHGFHNHVMYALPKMARQYPMNLAETASTFAEMVVSEAAFQRETDASRRLALLNAKLQRSVIFFFNIHARFLFETRFYEERKKGVLSTERLCSMMEEAQKEAYGGALEEYHPFFWASKLHFNLTDVPFYNFPYTFGYLFSTAIYHRAKTQASFEDTYIALLGDTGRMNVEELAKKHLKADLRSKGFWQETIDTLKQDAQQFLNATKTLVLKET